MGTVRVKTEMGRVVAGGGSVLGAERVRTRGQTGFADLIAALDASETAPPRNRPMM